MTFVSLFLGFLGIFFIIFFSYCVFDLFFRRMVVENFSTKIRTVKRYCGSYDRYWTQGFVFGFWIDYEYTIYEEQVVNDIQRLLNRIHNKSKSQEVLKEYDV